MKNLKKISLIIAASFLLFVFYHHPKAKFNESFAASGSSPAKTGEAISFPTKSAPGLFVNSSPAFSVSYPINWLGKTPDPQSVFMAEAQDGIASLRISILPDRCVPLKYSTKVYLLWFAQIGKDIKLIADKEVKLEDGRPAQETELEWIDNTGLKQNTILLTAKKECTWIAVSLRSNKGRIDDNLRKIAYSLKIKPEEDSSKIEEDIFFPPRLTESTKNVKETNLFPQAKAQKINETRLLEAFRALSGDEDTLCLLVERNGVMVMEKYFHGNTAERMFNMHSVTKSITSILVGIAIDKGFIRSIDQPISAYISKLITDFPAEKSKITIRDLLTMRSGLPWQEVKSYSRKPDLFPWVSSPNQLQWILNKPYEYAPGTHWHYNTGASHILSVVLQEATGMSSMEFAQKYLFEPIRSQVKHWNTDKQGYPYGGHGIWLDGRTMIKIGRMYLNKGEYNGKQVVSSNWVAESIKSRYSTDHPLRGIDGYGYLWWTGKDEVTGISYFMAYGGSGQFIICIPSKNTVVAACTEVEGLDLPDGPRNWYFVFKTILQNIFPALR